jgi:hypothetical protein
MALIHRGVRALVLSLALASLSLLSAGLGHAQGERACDVRVTLLQVNDVYRFTPADAKPCNTTAASVGISECGMRISD